MKDPVVHEALRQIQEIVSGEFARPISAQGRAGIEKVLHSAFSQPGGTSRREQGLTREVTIMLADLRGFTGISAAHPPAVVLDILNRCFATMSEVIFRNGGQIDKFMGDSILVLFEHSGGQGVHHAVTCAVDMQCAMEAFNALNGARGLPELYFGIGLNTGRVMSALLGSDLYSEYTVIGDEVNLAARIESFSLRGQVLMSESTWERCQDFVDAGDSMDVFVKGRTQLVVLRELIGIPSLSRFVPRQEQRRSPRVHVKLPFEFRSVSGGIVVPERRKGLILDIGYHGVLAEVPVAPSQLSELVLELEVPLVGQHLTELYGRVVTVATAGESTRIGVEFTSMTPEQRAAIQLFVQLLIQGTEAG